MADLTFPVLALLVFVSKIGAQVESGCVNKLVTFNAGLVHTIPSAKERKNVLKLKLQNMDADVVCLQEVFSSKDLNDILASVDSVFPFSYSTLHDEHGKVDYNDWNFPPCSWWTLSTFKCVSNKCDTTQPLPTIFACGMKKCDLWKKLNQECLTCTLAAGIKDVVGKCIGTFTTDMNIPGLVLLSKRPLRNRKTIPFVPNIKQIFPRSMLVADVERFGTVSCTHMTANMGPVYYEPALRDTFSSWEEQNMHDTKFIIDYFKNRSVVIMGDLNTGPKIVDKNITAEFEDSFGLFTSNGYKSPYVTLVGKGTYTDQNPYASDQSYATIIDHVLHKGGHKAVDAKRILDDIIDDIGGPLSDHYGVEVSLVKDGATP